ncbi:efflux RND transporter periplasmic adaptor subunit [Luteimicrobium subarcticum]|uniref:Macrolide-specific efflux system membrane fusion protein n=1 Tax=Luteimicrobium subarcticum TaxID=620910 RepID=A0A2M8W6Z4_9MICO|nr:biotin/lipoyl-binding protein [Luteimicrobium subarcticum]PJI86696.1 macrolide-specific efflux system membrane fusion protein [Luteimicrobium subarcticum]
MGALLHRAWDRPRTRLLVVGTAGVLVVAVALAWWFVWRSPDAGAATATSVTRTAEVSTTTIEKSVSASGTLTPSVQEDVSFGASGTVTSVKVAEGDTVKKGQVLGTIDTLELKADLLSAKADLASAKSDLATAEDENDGSDSAEAQVSAKEAQVDVAQAAVDTAEDAMDDATLKAPAAGLVTEVNVAKGDAVTGSSSASGSGSSGSGSSASTSGAGGTGSGGGSGSSSTSTSSSAQFVIVGQSSWEVSVTVGEDDIANVKKGEQVELTGDDLSDTVFGTVSSVGLLPSTSSGSVSYPVTVQVTGSPKGLYDGTSVTAAIVYERRSDVLAVPSAAVTRDGDTATVDVVDDEGTVTPTTVTVGETSGQMVEITKGLTEGQTVQYTQVVSTGNGGTGTGNRQQGELPGGGEGGFPGGGQGGYGNFPGGGGQQGGGNFQGGGGRG